MAIAKGGYGAAADEDGAHETTEIANMRAMGFMRLILSRGIRMQAVNRFIKMESCTA